MDKNKVLFGLRNVHVAFKGEEGAYDTPKPIPGAVNLGLSGEGDTETFYADDIPYFTYNPNNGYTGDLEMALVPDWFKIEALGWVKDKNGMVIELADGEQKEFALLFEVQGNKAKKRYVYYKCTTGKPSEEHGTIEDTRTPQTQTLTITIMPDETIEGPNGKIPIKGDLEMSLETATAFNAFYDSVLLPDFTPAP